MTKRIDIANELLGLKSILALKELQNVYDIPDGYFDAFPGRILDYVRSVDVIEDGEEIKEIAPVLHNISKHGPYYVPEGYFDKLGETLFDRVYSNTDDITPAKELQNISPVLSGMSKQLPYKVPNEYFEQVEMLPHLKNKHEAKVIPITHRKWFKYASAAVVVIFIVLGGLLFERRSDVDLKKNPDEWIAKNVKKVNANRLDDFIRLSDVASSPEDIDPGEKSNYNEIINLMKDVPQSQIRSFIDETAILGDDNLIMN